jgi:hypothetical protein
VVNATNDLTSTLVKQPVKATEIAGMLDGVVQKIQVLKRKVIFMSKLDVFPRGYCMKAYKEFMSVF